MHPIVLKKVNGEAFHVHYPGINAHDMNNTSTRNLLPIQNNYEFDVAVKALLADKLVLLPTDTVWSLACLPEADQSITQMSLLKRNEQAENFEVLFESIAQLKSFVPSLPPKLETLLSFHRRPLTLLLDGAQFLPAKIYDAQQRVAVRIVQDPICSSLIKVLRQPLISAIAATKTDALPTHLGVVRSDFLQGVDYVLKLEEQFQVHHEEGLSVKVRMDEYGELDFIRE